MSSSVRESTPQGPSISSPVDPGVKSDFDLQKYWAAEGSVADLPIWTHAFVGDAAAELELECDPGIRASERTLGDWAVRTVVVPAASLMRGQDFEQATRQAYRRLLRGIPRGHLLRAWNFIPRINDPAEDDRDSSLGVVRDRYMAFNAGRFQSFQDVYQGPLKFPVASGVGHAGEDLILHLLHGDGMPRPVDNPRQVLPAEYSEKFGDLPPAFVRAATIQTDGGECVLVSGTASVVGEDSAHAHDFNRQLEETLDNLTMVVGACRAGITPADLDHWLIYLPNSSRRGDVLSAVKRRWPRHQVTIEFRTQQLCRPELLVEIECAGLATAAERDA
jgi:enamine deaminase RidA (YjgF/YER057c/UK114 family)